MGRLADRVGTRWTVIFGALMIGVGLSISTLGSPWALWIGHGLFMGLIGLGGINAPLYIYVSRWFDRRRGSALALISSGSYLAGALWPPLFERAIAGFGWRQTMLCCAIAEIVVIVPLAAIYFRHPPELFLPAAALGAGGRSSPPVRPAAQPRLRDHVRRRRDVLPSDGDAAGPSGRLLHRSRHQPLDRRADALGAARHRFPQPANLGRDLRPHRRSRHRADRFGLAGRIDGGFSVHPERDRPVHRGGRVRAGLFRHHPGLCAGRARIVSGLGSLVANPDAVDVHRVRHGRRRLARRPALRSFRHLRAGLCGRRRRQSAQSGC